MGEMDDDSLSLTLKLAERILPWGTLLLSFAGSGIEDGSIKVEDAPLRSVLQLKVMLADQLSRAKSEKVQADKIQLLTEKSGILGDDVRVWEAVCDWHSDLDDAGLYEEPLDEWRPLVPGQSKVRIMKNPDECEEKCHKVRTSWGEAVHHMNGCIYTVIENLPPMKYLVYDPVCHSKRLQKGKIYVPFDAVCAVLQPQVAACVSGVQRMSDEGALQVDFNRLTGEALASVVLWKPSSDVAALRAALAEALGMEPYLVKILTEDSQLLDDSEKVEEVLGASMS
eukprot:TRINITY_DN65087_c0_g1_i1.p1 TRINITY_DN65087_c0_g1~~TRINITY_DN65087_c0_g1_i1.p1  ORF type:complete len:282 (-),score=30.43 TRINITY_DN65087_c0_g1_i1:117-962(-)